MLLLAALALTAASAAEVTMPCVRYHPEALTARRPNCSGEAVIAGRTIGVSYNALGLRDRNYRKQAPPGVKRVLFIGGSLAFGSGLQEPATAPRRLEAALRGRGRRVEVINAAVEGYTGWQNAVRLQEYLDAYHPDVVVHHVAGHYLFTDLAATRSNRPLQRLLLARRLSARPLIAARHSLLVYGELWRRARSSRALAALPEERRFDALAEPTLADLRRMRAQAEAAGARFFVAYGAPSIDSELLHLRGREPSAFAGWIQARLVKPFRFDGSELEDRLRREGFAVLPLPPRPPTLAGDFHWNEEGAALVGETLAGGLEKLL